MRIPTYTRETVRSSYSSGPLRKLRPGRTAILAALGLGPFFVPIGTSAQAPASGLDQVDVRAEVAAALYAASATQAAAARATNVRIRQQDAAIQALQAQLATTESARAEDVARLQAELTAAEEGLVTALAQHDRTYREEITVFRDAVEDIASSREGAAALARFNAGDEIGALEVLDELRAARDAARQRRADIESAAEGRRIARLALEARNRGKVTTSEVIARFEEVTQLDPNVFGDWVEVGWLYGDAGDLSGALHAAERAADTAVTPRDRSIALHAHGDVLRAQGDLPGAVERYRASLEIRERLAAQDPDRSGWMEDLAISHNRIGRVLVAQGDLSGALDSYRASLRMRERLVQLDPDDTGRQRGLVISQGRVGDVLLARGDPAGALEIHRASFEILDRLIATDPGSIEAQRDLSFVHVRTGDGLRAQGNLTGALESYRASLEIRERLAAVDPGNNDWQRDLEVSHERVGLVLETRGDLSGALEHFQASFEIRERLAAAEPGNADFQWDLSLSYDRMGDMLGSQEDFTGAQERLRASLEIKERLTAADPGNAGWQRDLSVTHGRLGMVLFALEDETGAFDHFTASLEISKRLVGMDPANATWQRDLLVSYWQLHQATDEVEYARHGLDLALRMQSSEVLQPRDQHLLRYFERRARP